MCGICGVFDYAGLTTPVTSKQVLAMARTMVHRGPDDEGVYLSPDGRLGLGFRRLAIVDLSPAGHEPMPNEDESIWLVFNGEIYNHADHRPGLEARGHRYRSRADSEAIIHLYEEYGEDVVHHLRGMFAFAIWDAGRRRLLLARDRIGIKPLYYTFRDGALLFASEIKALLAYPGVAAEMDEEALSHYLTFAATPPPLTLFRGIHKLAPGHRMIVEDGGRWRLEHYWEPLAEPDGAVQPEQYYVERLRHLLRESIKLRMMSDVPFGVFLSGGVDSSLNVALMSELMDRPVQTFSVAIEGDGISNEFEHARAVSRRFGTDHHEVVIGEQEFVDFLPRMVYHQDEPLADPVCVPLHYLSDLTRRSGTIVVQVGEGSDELFCGYRGYAQHLDFNRRFWSPYQWLPRPARQLAYRVLGPTMGLMKRDFLRRASYGGELFWGGAIAFWEMEKARLLSSNGVASSEELVGRLYQQRDSVRPDAAFLDRMIYLELKLRLPELLLMRVDKITMASSIEARVPFLDHELVKFALAIPPEFKYRNGTTKYILKRAAEGILDAEIIDRKKAGFCGSSENMVTPALLATAERDVLASPLVRGRFNLGFVSQLFARQRAGRTDYSFRIWNLWNLALWHRHWIENQPLQAGEPRG